MAHTNTPDIVLALGELYNKLRVESCGSRVASCGLGVTGYEARVTGYEARPASRDSRVASCGLRDPSHGSRVTGCELGLYTSNFKSGLGLWTSHFALHTSKAGCGLALWTLDFRLATRDSGSKSSHFTLPTSHRESQKRLQFDLQLTQPCLQRPSIELQLELC